MSRIAYYICTHDRAANPHEPHLGYVNATHEAPLYLGTYAADVISDTLKGNLALTRLMDLPDEKCPADADETRE